MSIELSNFLFLDIETTGLRPDRGARITEIAIYSRSQQIEVWRKNKNEFIKIWPKLKMSAYFDNYFNPNL